MSNKPSSIPTIPQLDPKSCIQLKDRQSLQMDGVEEVISYHEGEVLLHTTLGALRIIGEKLQLQDLCTESHQCRISGQIGGLIYEKSIREQKQSFWSKLLR